MDRKVLDFTGATLSIRDLPAEPHHYRDYHLALRAPSDLGTAVVKVPAGDFVTADMNVASLADGVVFTAHLHAEAKAECSRCLEPISVPLQLEVHEMFFTAQALQRIEKESGAEAVADLCELDGDEIALEEMFRDALVTAMPYVPLCEEDCPGLCDRCGQPWAQLPDDHQHVEIDPRFAKLAALLPPQSQEDE